MSDAHWSRLQALFDALVDIAPAQRAEWLRRAEPDRELHAEVLALLAADETVDDLPQRLERAAAEGMGDEPAAGLRLGNYRLIREIGSGGMGSVFLAERVDAEFDRRVAIKLIRGIATREAALRLRRERQILADLDHPHIARLLDGGTSDAGQPYLVMEYIQGASITDFCAGNALPLPARLMLLQQVCMAVHYAHQRLVIHRDLKPANVLVRPDGSPALLDFGIAKLLDAGSDVGATLTALPLMTPAYASPEQRQGRSVSTATDIHGLGVLLFEMLVGRAARGADGSLPAPSELAVGSAGCAGIDRELDTIVGKATHADPDRRYGSAEALAADIDHYLRGEPIQAAPDSWRYRSVKFVRRHRWPVAFATAAVLLAATFTWRLTVERDRALHAEQQARQESAAAEQVVDYLISLFEIAAPERGGERSIAPRELVDRGRNEIERRLADQPGQRARLLAALGDIYERLGLTDEAIQTLEAAVALQRQIAPGDPRLVTWLESLSRSYGLAERHDLSGQRIDEARQRLEQSQGKPADMARVLGSQAYVTAHRGDVGAAITLARNAVAMAELAAGTNSEAMATALSMLSESLRLGGKLDESRSTAEQSVAILRQLKARDDEVLVSAIGHLSEVVRDQGDAVAAEALLREMLSARTPNFPADSARITTVRNNLARTLYAQGRLAEAAQEFAALLGVLRGRGEQASYLIALNNLASIHESMGDYAAACPMFREVLENSESDSQDGSSQRLPMFRQNLGRCLMLAGQLEPAWIMLTQPVPQGDSASSSVEAVRQLFHQGEWLRRSRRLSEALTTLQRAESAIAGLTPDQQFRRGAVLRSRGLVLADQGRFHDAVATLREAVDVLAKHSGESTPGTLEARIDLAGMLILTQQRDEADRLLDNVAPHLARKFVESAPARLKYQSLRRE